MKPLPLAAVLGLIINIAPAELTPFQIAWDDASPGITSLATWQDEPAGSEGWVTVNRDAHFEVGGDRIRFLGVNIGAGDTLPTKAAAEKVAARLARFGINNVRFHHMDADWASPGLIDYSQATTRNLNPVSLDRLHYFVSELKANGVYSNINLLVSHHFRSADGLPAEADQMEWKDQQVLSFFNDTMVDLQKEYATHLLDPVNPYTGLRLADDPAVAFVEILNENGATQNWFSGVLDTMPVVFRDQLNGRWNNWLQNRYGSTENLLTAWGSRDEPPGPNKMTNGDFSAGVGGWTFEEHDTARITTTATTDFNGQPSLKVAVTTAGSSDWHVQIHQPNKTLEAGKLYTVSFWAKADRPVGMNVGIQRAHTDWAGLGFSLRAELTTDWQFFTSTFEATVDETNARLNFNGFGNELVTVWLADVVWAEGGEVGSLPEGVTLEASNIPSIPHASASGGDTLAARQDWVRFLLDLENAYWDTMNRHIKETLGYRGLVFGTIISNSPPNVQARLDVVDSHAYWKHPVFPNIPWDPVDWTIENESMVNDPGGSTLVGLARQRVKGKPHTVTEYQHPSPITYSAEAPLLVAAYGALQDWDGIWLFDYGTGSQGYINGFFDQAHHPTKMANTLLAAALFRRFDVRPARKEITMKMDPATEIETVTSRGQAWRVGDGSHLGVPGELALVSRLNLSVGEEATGLETPPSWPGLTTFTSDTGELTWDVSRLFSGIVTVDTERTKAIVGFVAGRSFDLGGVVIAPGTTEQDWCTIGLTLIEGERFDHPAGGRALLIATGTIENTGMIWKDAGKTSVGANWGRSPTLVEVIPSTVTLPVQPERVRVFLLDSSGNRIGEISVTESSGQARFQTTSANGTLWYEIEITPGGPVMPGIAAQPQSVTVEPGGDITLSIKTSGYPTPTITWMHGDAVVGQGAEIALQNVTGAQAGAYQAMVTNAAGTIASRTVQVGVRALPSTTEILANISTRGWVGTADQQMIAGFVVAGTGSRRLLIRAIGPGLSEFGVTGILPDPFLSLVNQTTPLNVLYENDNWVPTEVDDALQLTGAHRYSSEADSALLAVFGPAAYTATVSGQGATTGVGLVEVFDAGSSGPQPDIRLSNLSTRGRIEAGAGVLIAGFVIEGEVPMPVLIRGIGPALANFGVAGSLEDPVLHLYKQEMGTALLVARNDNWSDDDPDDRVTEASLSAGAFLLPRLSADAAIVIWLEPGAYTAQVSGYPGETGVGLVEVYGL